jgi:hypothetical protein
MAFEQVIHVVDFDEEDVIDNGLVIVNCDEEEDDDDDDDDDWVDEDEDDEDSDYDGDAL